MKLTEGKIREAQEIIEAVMEECDFWFIDFNYRRKPEAYYRNNSLSGDLADIYINRLHELGGTTPPPF